jgi:predicted enzyme related to lactoylglutathione lyase
VRPVYEQCEWALAKVVRTGASCVCVAFVSIELGYVTLRAKPIGARHVIYIYALGN